MYNVPMSRRSVASLFAMIALSSTSLPVFAAPDIIFTNGNVITMENAQPKAEAVAVEKDKIVFVGTSADAKKLADDSTEIIDLAGKTMMPGFVSAHDHVIASAWTNAGIKLLGAKNREEIKQRILDYVAKHPDEKVIVGQGWNPDAWGNIPTAAELDELIPDKIAILLDFTVHDGWLNTKAMEAGGINKDTPDLQPGTTFWRRDADGNPTGVAVELQWFQTYIDIGAWDAEKMIAESMDFLFGEASKSGMTAVLNPGMVTPNATNMAGNIADYRIALDLLEKREKEGSLALRTFPCTFFKAKDAVPETVVDFTKEMAAKYNSDMLRVSCVKIHPEGNWNSNVGPFLEPYTNKPDSKGTFGVQPEVSRKVIMLSNEAGFDVAVHAEGDASTRASIDNFIAAREAGYTDARNALHHLIWSHPDDVERILKHKIAVNATPQFSTDFGDQDKIGYDYLGKERVEKEMGNYTEISNRGGRVSIAADVPSNPPSMIPLLYQVQVATTLRNPDDPKSKPFPPTKTPMSLDNALRAITIDAAWFMRMEDKIGSIKTGKYADLVVLDKSPYDVPLMEISRIDVLATILGGEFTHVHPSVEEPKVDYIMPDDLPTGMGN